MSATVYNFLAERDRRRPASSTDYEVITKRNEALREIAEQVERECYIQGFGLTVHALNAEALRRYNRLHTAG